MGLCHCNCISDKNTLDISNYASQLINNNCYVCFEYCKTKSPCRCRAPIHQHCYDKIRRMHDTCSICNTEYSSIFVKHIIQHQEIRRLRRQYKKYLEKPTYNLFIIACTYNIPSIYIPLLNTYVKGQHNEYILTVAHNNRYDDLLYKLIVAGYDIGCISEELSNFFKSSRKARRALLHNRKKNSIELQVVKDMYKWWFDGEFYAFAFLECYPGIPCDKYDIAANWATRYLSENEIDIILKNIDFDMMNMTKFEQTSVNSDIKIVKL